MSSRRPVPFALFLLAVFFVAVAASCGGAPALDEEDRNLAARMREALSIGSPEAPVATEEADCLAERAVRELGRSEGLAADYGVSRSSIADGLDPWQDVAYTSADADALAAATFDCIDMRRVVGDRLIASGTVDDAAARCIADDIDTGLLQQQAAAGYRGEPSGDALDADIDADFRAAAAACGAAI